MPKTVQCLYSPHLSLRWIEYIHPSLSPSVYLCNSMYISPSTYITYYHTIPYYKSHLIRSYLFPKNRGPPTRCRRPPRPATLAPHRWVEAHHGEASWSLKIQWSGPTGPKNFKQQNLGWKWVERCWNLNVYNMCFFLMFQHLALSLGQFNNWRNNWRRTSCFK